MNLPPDFKAFWESTLQEACAVPLQPSLKKLDPPSPDIELYDLRFQGLHGACLAAYYLLPKGRPSKIPGVLQFHGYLSCKSEPAAHLPLVGQGMAVLAVDVRGQAGASTD